MQKYTKFKIIESAINNFALKGCSFSLKDIADEVKIKKASIYNHFESKEELISYIVLNEIENFHSYRKILFKTYKNNLKEIFMGILDYYKDVSKVLFWRQISLVHDNKLKTRFTSLILENDKYAIEKIIEIFDYGKKDGIYNKNIGMQEIGLFKMTIQSILENKLISNLSYSSESVLNSHFIDELWQYYEELLSNGNYYKSLIDNSPVGYAYHKIICDENGIPCDYEFIETNHAFELFTGLKSEDVKGKKITEVVPEINNINFKWIEYYGNLALNGGESQFEEFSEPLSKWYRISAFSPKKYYFVTQFIDISKEKQQFEELKNFFNVNLDLLCIADMNGNFIKINKKWEKVLGYSYEKLSKSNFLDLVHPNDKSATIQAIEKLRKEENIIDFINRYRNIDGKYETIEWRSTSRNNLIYASARDITKQINVENNLKRAKEIISFLADNFNTQIWFINDIYTYGKANQAHLDFIGKKLEDVEGKKLYDIFPKNEAEACIQGNIKIFAEKKEAIFEEKLLNAKKEKRIVKIIKTLILNEQGSVEYLICSAKDITEIRNLENQIKTKEKLLTSIVGFTRKVLMNDFYDLSKSIPKSLELLGKALNIDRVYYWENHFNNEKGMWLTSQKFEWCLNTIQPQIDNPSLQNIPLNDVGDFIEPLSKGEAFIANVNALPDGNTKEILQSQQILSILVLPVFVNKVFWGFVGFDACKSEKNWNSTELTLLNSFSQILSKSIERIELAKQLEETNKNLSSLVEDKTKEIKDANIATIFALAKLAEMRDNNTGRHLERVAKISNMLAKKLKSHYSIIDDKFIECINISSALHDIGKVAISDCILLKKGKLSENEYTEIKNHTIIGADTLKEVYERSNENAYIKMGIEIALHHHEKWDGSGYPYGIRGNEIPVSAQIVAICDVYDALRSERPYKIAFNKDKSLEIIKENRGKHFNPLMVDIFIQSLLDIESLYI